MLKPLYNSVYPDFLILSPLPLLLTRAHYLLKHFMKVTNLQ